MKKTILITISIIAAVFVLSSAVFYLLGGRFFIIQTPSMATYAPVGTLVLSKPAQYSELNKGDMILFHPNGQKETYFHRIVKVTPQGLNTQGDLNGSVDPWFVQSSDVVGTELIHVKHLGFLIRVLPFILVGGFAGFFVTRRYVSRLYRFPVRVAVGSLLVSIAVYFSRPFFNAVLISQTVNKDKKGFIGFVNTGIFGLKGTAVKGSSAPSFPGQLATVSSYYHDKKGYYEVTFAPNLHTYDWIILITAILLPAILCIGHALWVRKHYVEDIIEKSEETSKQLELQA
jgi:signal peptidase I